MLHPNTLPVLPADSDEMRSRAIEDLYRRRDRIDALIRELERYQEVVGPAALPVNASRKCS